MNISFVFDNFKLNHRVAAIIEYNNKYLLQLSERADFYALLGGRVELGEDSTQTIIREMKEEIGIDLKKEEVKLINITENFFTLNNHNYHEILYIFKIKLNETNKITKEKDIKLLDKETTILNWFSEEEIKNMDLRPQFSKSMLKQETFEHLINRD